MFCTQCGHEVEQHANFCSKCGLAVARKKTAHDMTMHITILAWLFIGSGILLGILAMLIMFMAVFLVFHFPIGTAIAVYAFWILFSEEGREFYKSRSAGLPDAGSAA